MKKPKRPKPAKPKRQRTMYEPVLPLTKEELHFAIMTAHAAATGKTPRRSFRANFEEAQESGRLEPGEHLVLTDHPMNHAGMAILDAFKAGKQQGGQRKNLALLWRGLTVCQKVTADPRFKEYTREENGERFVHEAILEAMATTPMTYGREVPMEEIYSTAARLKKEEEEAEAAVSGVA